MDEKVLIVKYGEVAMRKNNQYIFISRLVSSIRRNLDGLGEFYVVKEQGRLIIESRGGEMDFDKIIPRVIKIFGILGVCPGVKTKDQGIENLKRLALEHVKEYYAGRKMTFKVQARRANKDYPLISNEICAIVGEHILENMPDMTVDVRNPEAVVSVELRNDAYVFSKFIEGYGGLPYGSSGRAVSLLSGGIDSPVATWMMAKRGLYVDCVYFNSPPYTSERAKQKVVDLASIIAEYTGGIRLHIVPFTELQLYLLENVPEDKLTIFLKRAMMRCGQAIAEKSGAMALITGDSVGQVASQTMQAIFAVNSATTMPVLRPLAGMDKQEIIDIAEKIGTFETSIQPFEDCCTIFVAKHPETKPSANVIKRIEAKLEKLDEMLEQALAETEVIDL
ncbi:MAG: tRNA 4-thiouridine(8) synthase ThiI [Lachnospiraceae bacterium]|nr:tRNA 4-thiouridine(8) synthase ThiI [Lachnospiraceae bacterium]